MPETFTIVVEDKNEILTGKSIGEQADLVEAKLGCRMTAIGVGNQMTLSEDQVKQLKELARKCQTTRYDFDNVENLIEFIERM